MALVKPSRVYFQRAHPLARGLVSGYAITDLKGLLLRDFVGPNDLAMVGAVELGGSPWGAAAIFDGSASYFYKSTFDWNVGSTNGTPITIVSVCIPNIHNAGGSGLCTFYSGSVD